MERSVVAAGSGISSLRASLALAIDIFIRGQEMHARDEEAAAMRTSFVPRDPANTR